MDFLHTAMAGPTILMGIMFLILLMYPIVHVAHREFIFKRQMKGAGKNR